MFGSPHGRARDWDENTANRSRNLWCSDTKWSLWHRRAGDHDGYPASDADAHSIPSGAKQPGAAKATTRKVPAASRLWWNFRLPSSVCVKNCAQNTKDMKNLPSLILCREVALSDIRSMAWNQRKYQERWWRRSRLSKVGAFTAHPKSRKRERGQLLSLDLRPQSVITTHNTPTHTQHAPTQAFDSDSLDFPCVDSG